MNSNFASRVFDRFDNNPLNVRARGNEIYTMENASGAMPDLKDIQWALENFLIKVPGAIPLFLYAITRESVATLQLKIQGRTGEVVENKDFWDTDLRDISPITRDLEDWRSVRIQNSMNGIPIKGWYLDGMQIVRIRDVSEKLRRL